MCDLVTETNVEFSTWFEEHSEYADVSRNACGVDH